MAHGHSKEERLSIYDPLSDEHKFVEAWFDLSQTAPLDALILLTANRIAKVDGVKLSCEDAEQMANSVKILSKLTTAVVREHAQTHVPDLLELFEKLQDN